MTQAEIRIECGRLTNREAHAAHDNCPGTTLYTEQLGTRAYVFNFVGTDGRRASIVFDRYGRGAEQFNKYTRAQLTSNALGSVMSDPAYGPNWLASYTVTVVDL